ncbi:MAG: lipase family protein [Puniceicoccales bacterium]|jgi:hypothetical protein|nr:lipase family protein [Puniceicoccales bacterium]
MGKFVNGLWIVLLLQNLQAIEKGNGNLVIRDGDGLSVQPWFQSIQPDLIHLIKRSYAVTKRSQEYCFDREEQMLQGEEHYPIAETGHQWYCGGNFTGTHGRIEKISYFRRWLDCCLECLTGGEFAAEIDFPGFVALKQPDENCPYYIIAIVLRGSQGEDFQPGSGQLGASWATNYDAGAQDIDQENFGFTGAMHAGYVTKIRSCDFSAEDLATMVADEIVANPLPCYTIGELVRTLEESVKRELRKVPPSEWHRVRFVVTGHSQGGGLAQVALPYVIHKFGGAMDGFVNNVETPRFFGYFLSAPRVAADQETRNNYENFVGPDNMISHFAFRDIVTMACLHGYVTLGHLACDSAYDVLYRGICSEIAHNNRLLLMKFFRRQIQRGQFDVTDKACWTYKGNANLKICWPEIQYIFTNLPEDQFNAMDITPALIGEILNKALNLYRRKHSIIVDAHTSDTFFSEALVEHLIRIEDREWKLIREICSGDLLPQEIRLDEERRNTIRKVEENISGNTVSWSANGCFNIVALLDTALDLVSGTRDTHNSGGLCECLGRVFCCSCCCSRPLNVHTSLFFDEKFRDLVAEDALDFEAYGITPAGGIPLFAYLHYGSSANAHNKKLFDAYLPSRNLKHALRNGQILNQNADVRLQSELYSPAAAEDF